MVTWLFRTYMYLVGMLVIYRYRVHVECQCNFPASLRGSWNGADRGIMTFENSSFLTSYTSTNTDTLPATLDFNCFEKQEIMFLLKATYELTAFGGLKVKFYLCIEIHIVDDSIAYYYQLTEYSPFVKDNIFGYVPDNVVMLDVCARDIAPQNFIVMVKNGGGMYHCVHSITDGQTTFLAVWNNDIGVSNPFSCFALQRVSDTVLATESPRYCSNTSSSSTAEYGGVKIILTDMTKTCEEIQLNTAAQSTNLDGLWSLMGLPVVLLVLIVISVLIYRKKMALKRRIYHDFFGSGPKHVDVVGKPIFDPSVIHQAKMYNLRPKKTLSTFTPIWDGKWKPKQTLRMTPEPKVAPLYSDVIDD